MTLDCFNQIIESQIDICRKVLAEKGKEYALSTDRLEHFKDAATEQGISPKLALWGMLQKHLSSLNGMCKNGCEHTDRWSEKITDSINYLLMLMAVVLEENSHEE